MRQAISVLVLLLVIVGCKTSRKFYGIDVQSGPCKGLDKFLKENWKYDKDSGIYSLKNPESDRSLQKDYWDCFTGLNRDQVKRVLGAPSIELANSFRYCLDEGCLTPETSLNFSFLTVRFDKEGNVTFIGRGGGGWIP